VTLCLRRRAWSREDGGEAVEVRGRSREGQENLAATGDEVGNARYGTEEHSRAPESWSEGRCNSRNLRQEIERPSLDGGCVSVRGRGDNS
jgi:hypothetical protein